MVSGHVGGVYFFFQAEDGIRDYDVTGVQTCALPILVPLFLIPFLLLVVKNGPEDLQKAENEVANKSFDASNQKGGFTLQQALRSKNFWLLSLMAFCTFYAILAMTGHVFLLLREENYAPQIAATGLTEIGRAHV